MGKLTDRLRADSILVSDGAWGTFLQSQGLKNGECPELWNVENRPAVLKVAQSYVKAGSDIIETNSFGGNAIKLRQFELAARTFELNKAAATISREAAGINGLVIGSVGPTGKILMMGDVTENEIYTAFAEQIKGLVSGGVDALCLETFFDLAEAKIAIQVAKDICDLEIITTFSFEMAQDGAFNTMMGVSPSQMAKELVDLGVDIIGTNCSNGFERMIQIVEEIRRVEKDKAILVHANAGMPHLEDGVSMYPDTPEIMADLTPRLLDAGAQILGGCCGTSPDHIKQIKQAVESYKSEAK